MGIFFQILKKIRIAIWTCCSPGHSHDHGHKPIVDAKQAEHSAPISHNDTINLAPAPKDFMDREILNHDSETLQLSNSPGKNRKSVDIAMKLYSGEELRSRKSIMPLEYFPDKEDKKYRDPQIDEHSFHEIGAGRQCMNVVAAIREQIDQKQRVVIKEYHADSWMMRNLWREPMGWLLGQTRNLLFLSHPNVVTFLDSFYEEGPNRELKFLWIVNERMDCTLNDWFHALRRRNNQKRDHRHVAALFVQIFRALEYLHERGIVHHDINPKNIGLNLKGFVIKLLDFGAIPGESHGDERYYAPRINQPLEMLLHKRYDTGVDIWATGLVALSMLGFDLMLPSRCNTSDIKKMILNLMGLPEDRYSSIFQDALKYDEPRPSTLEKELDAAFNRLEENDQLKETLNKEKLKDLFIRVLDVNPQTRPRASECLHHPYLRHMNQSLKGKARRANETEERNAGIFVKKLLSIFASNISDD